MFVKGKLIVDEESYNILRYESGRYQMSPETVIHIPE